MKYKCITSKMSTSIFCNNSVIAHFKMWTHWQCTTDSFQFQTRQTLNKHLCQCVGLSFCSIIKATKVRFLLHPAKDIIEGFCMYTPKCTGKVIAKEWEFRSLPSRDVNCLYIMQLDTLKSFHCDIKECILVDTQWKFKCL